jgi:hypothetical protein
MKPDDIVIKFTCKPPLFYPDSEHPILAYVMKCMTPSQRAYFKAKWGADVFIIVETTIGERHREDKIY